MAFLTLEDSFIFTFNWFKQFKISRDKFASLSTASQCSQCLKVFWLSTQGSYELTAVEHTMGIFCNHKRFNKAEMYVDKQDYADGLSVPQYNDWYIRWSKLCSFFSFRERNSWLKVASVARNTRSLLIQQRHANIYWTSAQPNTNSMHRWIRGNFVKLHQVSSKCLLFHWKLEVCKSNLVCACEWREVLCW